MWLSGCALVTDKVLRKPPRGRELCAKNSCVRHHAAVLSILWIKSPPLLPTALVHEGHRFSRRLVQVVADCVRAALLRHRPSSTGKCMKLRLFSECQWKTLEAFEMCGGWRSGAGVVVVWATARVRFGLSSPTKPPPAPKTHRTCWSHATLAGTRTLHASKD